MYKAHPCQSGLHLTNWYGKVWGEDEVKPSSGGKFPDCQTRAGVSRQVKKSWIVNQTLEEKIMNEQMNIMKEYPENAYCGAKMMKDEEGMTRIARSLAA